jgi:hypothetical protein
VALERGVCEAEGWSAGALSVRRDVQEAKAQAVVAGVEGGVGVALALAEAVRSCQR